MWKMMTTVFILMVIFTSGSAYWDDLVDCMQELYLPDNLAVKKVIDALNGCNTKLHRQGKPLYEKENDCDEYNKKIDYDLCFLHAMGWINEDATKMNRIKWGQDNEDMSAIMGFEGEQMWEIHAQCLCDVKYQLEEEGNKICGNKSKAIGRYALTSNGRCAIAGMQSHCDVKKVKNEGN